MPDAAPDDPPDALPLLADVGLDVPGRDTYTYAVPPTLEHLAVGMCVRVPFGPRQERGFVTAIERRAPPVAMTKMRAVIDVNPAVQLPAHLLRLIQWGSTYYRCSLGEFLAGAVPAPVREGATLVIERRVQVAADFTGTLTTRQQAIVTALQGGVHAWKQALTLAATTGSTLHRLIELGALTLTETSDIRETALPVRVERYPLTPEQQTAVNAIDAARVAGEAARFLLYGVTGSGKTLVYLECAERCLAAGKQVLLLLPEIALTPQLAARIRTRIDRVAVWHSGFTQGERAEQWRRVAAGEVDLVVGTRSALFAPLARPGLIIVDEEHESSYKQDSVPRYHGRDMAVVYAQQLGVPVVLGSATPSLETVHNGREGRYTVLKLLQRPRGGQLPTPTLVDMRLECQAQKRPVQVSAVLINRLAACKAAGDQAIVLLNRRGWSPVVSCGACGETLMCPSCDISLTWHRGANQVRCHYCNFTKHLPTHCPACGAAALGTHGIGTEQLASVLHEAIPSLRILRVDADTVGERQGHAKLLAAFGAGEADCLVGTQMVAKGLDFPRVTVVGIVGADRALSVPEFRAAERTFQLCAQVAGRAGRGERSGTVVVQAWDVQALPLTAALDLQPRRFYDTEMDLRRQYGYPPFTGLARFLWSGPEASKVQLVAEADGARLREHLDGAVLLGPNPAGLAFLKGQHRWHALVKGASRGHIQAFLDRLGPLTGRQGVRVMVDVDPYTTA